MGSTNQSCISCHTIPTVSGMQALDNMSQTSHIITNNNPKINGYFVRDGVDVAVLV